MGCAVITEFAHLYPERLDRAVSMQVPTMAVIGSRDPLMPGPERIKEVAGQTSNHAILVIIEGAAHAVNFSHPDELANVIRLFMADQPDRGRPRTHPGVARTYELHRGTLPPPSAGQQLAACPRLASAGHVVIADSTQRARVDDPVEMTISAVSTADRATRPGVPDRGRCAADRTRRP